ncbi:thionin-like protein 2 [Quillaja saponaria]|uniref:Thionin-like protein 2 n=1 Tax=Quillaja saponaria TaxID=32244 RepID=A0AAD7LRN4_QUISA|nr:thionin-like protein 2 [Quillaja saponaria]
MEGKTVRSVLILTLFLGMLVGQSAADFKECYPVCLFTCAISGTKWYICPLKCTTDCLTQEASVLDTSQIDNAHFCKLGCAVSKCSQLSTENNPAVNKVDACVNSCSRTCLKY